MGKGILIGLKKKINALQFRVLIFILKDVRTSHVTRRLICIFALDSSSHARVQTLQSDISMRSLLKFNSPEHHVNRCSAIGFVH